MKCPKCNTEYREGFTKCSDCGEELIDDRAAKQTGGKGGWLFTFCEATAKEVISLLFYLGLLPMLFFSIRFGRILYLTNTYLRDISFIQGGQKLYTAREVNNLPLGIFGGIIFFIVAVLVWKVLCEILLIIFKAIETYILKNKS